MADKRRVLTADDLDEMTPNERAAAFDERIVDDLSALPFEFVGRVMETGRRLADEMRTAPIE